MQQVDNVTARLKAEQQKKDEKVTKLLRTMANQTKRQSPFPTYTSAGNKTKYGGTQNHRGRYCWVAVIGPVPATCEVVDYLPPAVKVVTWSAPEVGTGQRRIWLEFKALVHHQTVRKILGKMDLDVDYVNGCKVRDVQEAMIVNGVNKIVEAVV